MALFIRALQLNFSYSHLSQVAYNLFSRTTGDYNILIYPIKLCTCYKIGYDESRRDLKIVSGYIYCNSNICRGLMVFIKDYQLELNIDY